MPADFSSSPHIGLLGLGLMGQALAERLLRHGFHVSGWDIEPEACHALVVQGGHACEDVHELLNSGGCIILSLPDSKVVGALLEQNKASLKAGQIIVDTSTGDPRDAVEIAEKLTSQGVAYLDATVSGSSVQVSRGEAVCMVGGEKNVFEQCQEIWSAISARAFHTGPNGSGAKMKLVTNLVLGLNRAALAEGLAFAKSLDLDLESSLAIMRGSMAYSRIMDTKGEKMIRSDFTPPQARLSQHLKDVRLMIEATDTPLPLTQAHRSILESAEALGYGDMDNSAIIAAYQPSGLTS